MIGRAFAVVTDGFYYRGVVALLNSIHAYHGTEIPAFVFHRGLTHEHLQALDRHALDLRLVAVDELPHPSSGMWEAKQQVFARLLSAVECVYLADADLVLLSRVDDVFELARAGKIVSSADGAGVVYDARYAAYSPKLPGARHAYINSGALCLDTHRHWDLVGLWSFASQYGGYSPGGGPPLCLPGHGDQGLFNAIAHLLGKADDFHVLPERTWCDSANQSMLQIRHAFADGRLDVWNVNADAPQRVAHCTGPKWWTNEGESALRPFGDKYICFRHFALLGARNADQPQAGAVKA